MEALRFLEKDSKGSEDEAGSEEGSEGVEEDALGVGGAAVEVIMGLVRRRRGGDEKCELEVKVEREDGRAGCGEGNG